MKKIFLSLLLLSQLCYGGQLLIIPPFSNPFAVLSSLTFNGTNNTIDVGTTFRPAGTTPFLLAGWWKPATVSSGEQDFFSNRNFGDANKEGILFGFNAGDAFYCQVILSVTQGISARFSVTGVTANVWHHVACTSQGTDATGIQVYIDGVAATRINNNLNNNSGLPSYSTNLLIGNTPTLNDWLNGKCSNFVIAQGWAPVSGDITKLYNSGNPPNVKTLNLTGSVQNWYRMDNTPIPPDTPGTIYDRIGTNNGTGNNFTSGSFTSDVP